MTAKIIDLLAWAVAAYIVVSLANSWCGGIR